MWWVVIHLKCTRSSRTYRILSEVSPGVKVANGPAVASVWQRSGEHFGKNSVGRNRGQMYGD